LKTIDRDLDLAITEFAPGAQKQKIKGFTQPLDLLRQYCLEIINGEQASKTLCL